MSKAITRPAGAPLDGFMRLPAQRQVGLLLGLALGVAVLGVAWTWASRPTMVPVLTGLTERDTAEAMDALSRNGFEYRLDSGSGQLLVAAAKLHEARIRLATDGLPRASSSGFEALGNDSGFGTSRMVENARYHHALESELARSIMTLRGVEGARVHLALPRPSVFLRDRAPPTASVLVNLHPGRRLDDAQVAGIVHLVASSVPELEPEAVTVVDQQGRLLTAPGGHEGLSGRDLDYVQRLEDSYVRRIGQLLSPMLGVDGFRAQVAADVDFTMVESTHETWDPEGQVLRSEQLSEDMNGAADMPAGVPGALSNQPPPAGIAVPGANLPEGGVAAETGVSPGPQSTSRRSTRNYEVDRTVSHVRQAPASLRRLSVAVVVDHRPVAGEEGTGSAPLSEEELAHISGLVREAVGFDAERGDSVNVVSASFMPGAEYEAVAQPELWREPWVADLAKQVLLAVLALIALPLVLRPMLKNLSQQGPRPAAALPAAAGAPALPAAASAGALPGAVASAPARPTNSQDSLKVAQDMSREDPKRVAQVVRQWVATDGNQ
ncbi:flagellar basal-body MS-ring/collar protein FliF [Thioalkalivibrio sp. XN279]|uniref:flagellar basal-body MS-ring/collar protein FliF n=1 Tax=Thioalkalivibrio sp. XN279 TaxID=2714953 RepID=UPI001407EC8C|nr:flagellar basal-body MS-ring/collar protein FliF [Thioalkalivibrio sp. XN279]NHA13368.1 flagellar M-ring protein FliF [Thioalkalivibrio sp. XN279]